MERAESECTQTTQLHGAHPVSIRTAQTARRRGFMSGKCTLFKRGHASRTSLLPRGFYAVPAQLHEKRHRTLVIRKVIAGKNSKSSSTLPTGKHDTDIHAMKVRNSHL